MISSEDPADLNIAFSDTSTFDPETAPVWCDKKLTKERLDIYNLRSYFDTMTRLLNAYSSRHRECHDQILMTLTFRRTSSNLPEILTAATIVSNGGTLSTEKLPYLDLSLIPTYLARSTQSTNS